MKNTPDSPDNGAKNHQTPNQQPPGQLPPTHQQNSSSSTSSPDSTAAAGQADALEPDTCPAVTPRPQPNAVRVLFQGRRLARRQHGRRQLQQLQLQPQSHQQQSPSQPPPAPQHQQQDQSSQPDPRDTDPCSCRPIQAESFPSQEQPSSIARSLSPSVRYSHLSQQHPRVDNHGQWAQAMAEANRRLLERQMEAYREADSQRWNFDFINCRPLQNQGHRFEHFVETPRNCRPLNDQSNHNITFGTHRQGHLHQPPNRQSRTTDRGVNFRGHRGARDGRHQD